MTNAVVRPPGRGSQTRGPSIWNCGCGQRTTLDADDGNVVPVGWVKMMVWRGGASEYGLTKMDEKIMCPQCAWENNMGPKPPQEKLPPLLMKPPGPMKPLFSSSMTKALPKGK